MLTLAPAGRPLSDKSQRGKKNKTQADSICFFVSSSPAHVDAPCAKNRTPGGHGAEWLDTKCYTLPTPTHIHMRGDKNVPLGCVQVVKSTPGGDHRLYECYRSTRTCIPPVEGNIPTESTLQVAYPK